jgi:hypothetical protein
LKKRRLDSTLGITRHVEDLPMKLLPFWIPSSPSLEVAEVLDHDGQFLDTVR